MTPSSEIGPGSRITIGQRKVDAQRRTAEVVEVLGDVRHPRYRVRWEDGHESILAPGEDATIEPRAPAKGARGARQRKT